MFSWEGQEAVSASAEVALRDPRKYRIGLLTRGPWPDGPDLALYWFGRHPELAQFLMRVEPRCRGLAMGELIRFKAQVQDVITTVEVAGLGEQRRHAFNALSAPRFGVQWWGTLEALKEGRGDWPQEVLKQFQGLPAAMPAGPLDNRRTSEFIAYLQQSCAPSMISPDQDEQ